jgi:SAM-dependent methyltransferase
VGAVDATLIRRLAAEPDLLAAAAALDPSSGAARVERLRRDWPADLVAAALTQADLRRRAVAKFGPAAGSMFLTPDGLEQASRPEVAAHRAARFAAALEDGASGGAGGASGPVLDLCCGIGGDLVALGAGLPGREVVGVDRDPATAEAARLNLRAAGLGGSVVCADVADVAVAGAAAVFVDPARRASGRRTFDPGAYSPPLSFVTELAAAAPLSAVKVAPGIPHEALPHGAEAEWVSWRGELKEAALWLGGFAGVRRRATVLPSGDTLTDLDLPDGAEPGGGAAVGGPGAYLVEPDAAVIRSGLVAALSHRLPGGRLLDPRIAYIAADAPMATPFGACFAVDEVLPYSLKRLRTALRARGAGTVEIKVRGLSIDPAQLRRSLDLRGDGSCTVLLARLDDGPVAIVAQRA